MKKLEQIGGDFRNALHSPEEAVLKARSGLEDLEIFGAPTSTFSLVLRRHEKEATVSTEFF